ncbi:transcriptional regulator, TetR family [Dyella sp. OK004]|uniref:TetR/AcrR family transcriptional regulator n=1 Tax=Dyella sp. OK004 TaxID=1855292 RepID=UPI0008F10226|nr:TetR/AcrR family transcriptional regulator [Dyella sp. OK004]SFS04209.1 transcriptional regulator, TetR family [Dyella sp. OK004]
MKTDPSNLIEVSLSLFRSKGYRRTSMADIGRASGLLKGSIYHHFPNKERLLIEVIQHVISLFEDGVFAEARRTELSEKVRLDRMVDAVESYYIQHRVCALVHLWPDALQESTEAREMIQTFFRDWRDLLASLLEPRYGPAEAERLATDALARIEGAVIWLQIVGEESALRQCSEQVRGLL